MKETKTKTSTTYEISTFYSEIKKQNFDILKHINWLLTTVFAANALSITTGKVAGVLSGDQRWIVYFAGLNILLLTIGISLAMLMMFKFSQFNDKSILKENYKKNTKMSHTFEEELENAVKMNVKSIRSSYKIIYVLCCILPITFILSIAPVCLVYISHG